MPVNRRLAAILVADVAGYSALMERDEVGTFVRLKAHRQEIFEPLVKQHRGRIFKLTGDGLLAEFASVVDAVQCAVAVQRQMDERNRSLPDNERICIRIGVNLGDVIVEGKDRHGEGVNIAARLQQLAKPGGIVISGTAYDQLKAKVDVGYEFLGEQQVKNIAAPVRVYGISLDPKRTGTTIDAPQSSKGIGSPWVLAGTLALVVALAIGLMWLQPWGEAFKPDLPLPDKPSIAVLPFANMSGDPQQDFFADGMTDDLITGLSQVSGLFVISRNSTFVYKGRTIDPRQVAKELGVRYVLEGSVQRSPDRIRINAQLIDAVTNGHVWAERFDGSPNDVFALQDKVTRGLADALAIRLTKQEEQSLARSETTVSAAYDAFLHGWAYGRRRTPRDLLAAIDSFEEAVKLDPTYGRAYAALAWVYHGLTVRGWGHVVKLSNLDIHRKALEYLEQASKYPTVLYHQVNGLISEYRGDFATALEHYNKAISVDSSDALSYAYSASTLIWSGKSTEALPYLRTAMRLDPHYPSLFPHILGWAHFCLENYAEAALAFEEALKLNPEEERIYPFLAATYASLGRKQDAKAAVARFTEIKISRGDMPPDINDVEYRFADPQCRNRAFKGFLLAGMKLNAIGEDYAAKYQLHADEIRALFLGHTIHGHNLPDATEHSASVSKEGMASMSGDWGNLSRGTFQLKGESLCFLAPEGTEYCGNVFRIPGGTKAKENEYYWRGKTFSQTE
jgi:TolB-like protein/class 3 adenylate cyclase/Flp pilus assembly protein TadD